MKVGRLAVAVFRSLADRSSRRGDPSPVSEIFADVSIGSPDGALVDRNKLEAAVSLLLTSRLIEAEADRLVLSAEGDHFWRRISHLEPAGTKKWIREAVEIYSRGGGAQWAATDEAWADAEVLFLARHRSRMRARLEVLDGVLRALDNWHFVSSVIGAAADRHAALAALQGSPFFFSKVQANQIVDIGLSQRTALGRLSLAEERDAIRAELDGMTGEEAPDSTESSPNSEEWPEPAFLERTVEDLKRLAELPDAPRSTRSG